MDRPSAAALPGVAGAVAAVEPGSVSGAAGPVDTRWRLMALLRAVLAGAIASCTMLFTFALAYAGAGVLATLLPADQPALGVLGRWLYGLTHNVFIDTARPNL